MTYNYRDPAYVAAANALRKERGRYFELASAYDQRAADQWQRYCAALLTVRTMEDRILERERAAAA